MNDLVVEICLPISPSIRHPQLSQNQYQSLIAEKLADYLRKISLSSKQSLETKITDPELGIPNFKACCQASSLYENSPANTSDHQTHFVLIRVPISMLHRCATSLRPDLSIDKAALNECLTNLTPGQLVWLAELAICTLEVNTEDLLIFLKQIEVPLEGDDFLTRSNTQSFLFCLQQFNVISGFVLRHNKMQRREIWRNQFRKIHLFPNQDSLRSYFGDNVGFYFAWMQSYCVLLLGPTLIGFLCSLIGWSMYDPDANRFIPTPVALSYSVFVILWAILCTKLWSRQYVTCVDKWSQNSLIELTVNDLSWLYNQIDKRPQFRGYWRLSRVTGQMELHYDAWKRRCRYLCTSCVIIVCLFIAGFVNVALLNLEGNISAEKSPFLYLHWIGWLTEQNAFFDPNGAGIAAYLPGILHSLIVFVMNQLLFRPIAEVLVDWENHPTNEEYQRSLIIKRFLFELVDAYGCLAYLGFILADRVALRSLLLTMFTTDSIRRLTLECLIPLILYRIRTWQKGTATSNKKKFDSDERISEYSCSSPMNRELCADPYEPFDDYLEMVLQHGYLVLFAYVCPPVASALATVCTFLEAHFDAFKICWVTRRPAPGLLIRGQFIWLNLLAAQAWLSVLTNAGLFVADINNSQTQGAIPLSLIFLIFEHVLITLGLAIHFFISNIPAKVRDARRIRDLARTRLFYSQMDT